MKSEVVEGLLHVEGCKAPFEAAPQTGFELNVASPVLVGVFDIDRYGKSQFQSSIQGKAVLAGGRIAIAGYPETAATKAGFALKPLSEAEENRQWTATVAFLGDAATDDDEDKYLIEAFVPQSAFARIETAITYAKIGFLRLALDADGLWVADSSAEIVQVDGVWFFQPSRGEAPGIEFPQSMRIRGLAWETL